MQDSTYFQETMEQAHWLRYNEQYAEALPLYEKLWDGGWNHGREWAGWGYATCLRKLGRLADALDVCREVYRLNPVMEHNCSLYAWCIYDTALKDENSATKENERSFFRAVDAIIKLTHKKSKYSPRGATVFKVIGYLTEAGNDYPAAEILEWLDKLDPDNLSKDCWVGPGKGGKQIEHASEQEKWYAERSKALEKLERYQESGQVSLKALETVGKCHHDNDIWFNYRIAVADKHLGLLDEAQARLGKVHQKKRDYIVELEMAEVAHAQNRTDDAMKFACSAAVAPGPINYGFRWKIFFLLAQLFQEKGELALAKEHALLVWKIGADQYWNVPAEVINYAIQIAIDTSDKRSERDIHDGLMDTWIKIGLVNRQIMRGRIFKVNENGESGLIEAEDGKKYHYDSRELHGKHYLYYYGVKVEFYYEPASENGKRGSVTDIFLAEHWT